MSAEAALRGGQRSAALGPGLSKLLSDERLVRRAAGGDERAFAAIFERYHQALYRFCLSIVGNPEDAQDALQNAMASVLKALPGEERRIDLKPWLYRIAHNEAVDLLRRRRETRALDAELPALGPGLAEDMAVRERLRRLVADMGELPERQREVLVMRELGGLGFGEIGTALGTSDAVARQTLYEARRSLQQMEEGREMSCDAVTRALSDGDGRVARRRDVRAHLRTCDSCRRFRDGIKSRQRDFAALSPLPAAAAAALLHSLLGGPGNGGGLAAALGGGAAKSLGASTALKGAATVAAVAAIGVGAAEREGVIDLGGGSGGKPVPARSAADGAAAAAEGSALRAAGRAVHMGRRLAPGARVADDMAPDGAAARSGHSQAHIGTAAAGGAAAAEVRNGPAAAEGGQRGASAEAHELHPSGQGHAKQHPEAAAFGQETAGAQKGAGKGSSESHPAPAKPPAAEGEHPGRSEPPAASAGGASEGSSEPPPAPEASKAPEAAQQGTDRNPRLEAGATQE